METDPDEFDVDVASGSLLAIGFPHDEFAGDIGTTFDVAAFHRHVAVCPTTPAPSAPAPSAPAGGRQS